MTPEKQNHVKQHRRKSDKLNKLYKKIIGSKKDVINQSTHTAMLVSFEVVYTIYIIQEGDKYHNHKIMKSGYLCDKGNV